MKAQHLLIVYAFLCLFHVSCVNGIVNGTCGENVTWTLDEEGLLTISGTGDMNDFKQNNGMPWWNRKSTITHVVIEEGVTSVGSFSFSECFYITSVTLPESITSIGANAFYQCNRLVKAALPKNIKSIDKASFCNCGLKCVTIPDSIEHLGDSAFTSFKGSIFYLGTRDLQTGVFDTSYSEALCVSPNYNSSSFCGIYLETVSDTLICKTFRNLFNPCFTAECVDGTLVQQKRNNATLWESKTNGCLEFKCDDEKGPITKSICTSTNTTISPVCVEGKCVVSIPGKNCFVAIEPEGGMKVIDLNESELLDDISSISEVDKDALKIGVEMNEDGEIIRVRVYVDDKDTADRVSNALSQCGKESSATTLRDGSNTSKCPTVLKRVKRISTVITNEFSSSSVGDSSLVYIVVVSVVGALLILSVVVIIVLAVVVKQNRTGKASGANDVCLTQRS